MATTIDRLGRDRRGPLVVHPQAFQRGERSIPLQKSRKRRVLGTRQILAIFALLAGFFIGFREVYLFLITWDRLEVRKVEVHSAQERLRAAIDGYFSGRRLGNILLCDLQGLRDKVRRLGWVKDVRIQKVYPAVLRVDIVERTPFAILDRGGLFLADEEGVIMERVLSPDEYPLPVIADGGGFAERFAEKWSEARRGLSALPEAERDRLAMVWCSGFGTLTLVFRDDPVRIILDPDGAAEQVALYRTQRAEWEGLAGPLESVNLAYGGRVYLKALEPSGDAASPNPDKEAE